MNNYNEIAFEAIKNITKTNEPEKFASMNRTVYECAHEAAKLQAEKFNDDLDASYIKYFESQKRQKDV